MNVMPIAKCGIQFSGYTPIWCKGGDDEKCKNCPLNEKYKKTTVFDECKGIISVGTFEKENMIGKACDWLRENANNYIYEDYVEGDFKETKLDIDDLTETFKKAMEG